MQLSSAVARLLCPLCRPDEHCTPHAAARWSFCVGRIRLRFTRYLAALPCAISAWENLPIWASDMLSLSCQGEWPRSLRLPPDPPAHSDQDGTLQMRGAHWIVSSCLGPPTGPDTTRRLDDEPRYESPTRLRSETGRRRAGSSPRQARSASDPAASRPTGAGRSLPLAARRSLPSEVG